MGEKRLNKHKDLRNTGFLGQKIAHGDGEHKPSGIMFLFVDGGEDSSNGDDANVAFIIFGILLTLCALCLFGFLMFKIGQSKRRSEYNKIIMQSLVKYDNNAWEDADDISEPNILSNLNS